MMILMNVTLVIVEYEKTIDIESEDIKDKK